MRELADAGLRVELHVTDPDGLFALSLAAPVVGGRFTAASPPAE
jgi:hypothetical protein